MRVRLLASALSVVWFSAISVIAGPNGTVQVPRVSNGSISIDGSFADWPLDVFTTPSRQPQFPEAQDPGGSDALGDHLLFERDHVSYFGAASCNDDAECGPFNNAPGDFGSVIYMTYDSKALYFLGVFVDDFLQDAADLSDFGDNTFRNDGFEIFMDVFNDSDDLATELSNPPNSQFDDEEPNLDDFQLSFGLNENFETGARQHMERTGRPGLIGSIDGEPYDDFFDIVVGERNGPGGIYRDALTAFGQDIAATTHNDMRAIGAPNPELAANPDVTFTGYVLEAAVPFGFADLDDDGETNDDFVPEEGKTMGFSLFWNDTDGDTDANVGLADNAITRIFWTQGSVFDTNNWGQIEFGPAIGPDGDYNGNGVIDAGDLDVQAQYMKDNNLAGDLNGDGTTDAADRNAWITDIQKSWIGDSNFDGEFNSSDFVAVFTAAKYEKDEMATYGEGDWNGDMLFNSSDFVAAFTSGGYEKGPLPAAAVPEPSCLVLVCLGFVALFSERRKGNVRQAH